MSRNTLDDQLLLALAAIELGLVDEAKLRPLLASVADGASLVALLGASGLIDAAQTAELERVAAQISAGAGTIAVEPPSVAELRRSAAPSAEGHLGRYRIVGRLGAGGMGEVLSVRDDEVGREVAAKVIRRDGEAMRRKFVAEARVTGQLEHPGIVPLYDMGRCDGRPYFTMRRVQGRTLTEVFADAEVALAARLRIFLAVCDAVGFAHSRGVLHRDLKPDNVMVGEFGEVYVLDWGLARAGDADAGASPVDPDVGDARGTLEGTVLGTPAYMPPEQARGEVTALDERADVYALGAILYELLCGEPPYDGSDPYAILEQVKQGPPPPPSSRTRRPIDWQLEAAVRAAMAREPAERYDSARALARDVESYLEGRLLAGARYTLLGRVGRWLWRHRRAAAVLLVVAGSVGVALHQGRRAEDAEASAARSRRAVAVQKALGNLTARIESARPYLYIHDIDVAPRLARVRKAIAALEQVRDGGSLTAVEARRVHHLLGRAYLFVGETGLAEESLILAARTGVPTELVAVDLTLIYLHAGLLAHELSWMSPDASREQMRGALGHARFWQAHVPPDPGERRGAHALVAIYGELTTGRYESALRVATDRLAKDGARLGSEELHIAKARALLRLRRHEEADAAIAAALQRRPHYPVGLELRARVQRRKGEFERALATYDRALALQPRHIGLQLNRGEVLARLGRHEEAAQVFEGLLDLLPVAAHANLGLVRRAQGDLEAALHHTNRALEGRGVIPNVYCNRALIHIDRGAFGDAEADYDRALDKVPTLERALVGRAALRVHRGKLDEAIADLDAVLARDPDCSPARWQRGRALAQQGRLKRAAADFDRAVELAPADARVWHERGVLRRRLDDLAGARSDLDRAVALDAERAESWRERGLVRKRQRDLDGAIADYERALALDPRDAIAYHHRAVARRAKGDLKGALRDYDRALTLQPKYALALTNRGNCKRAMRDVEGALRDYGAAIALEPRLDALLNRGALLGERGKYRASLADFERALAVDPKSAQGFHGRAMAHRGLGDAAQAVRDCRRATELDPDRWLYWAHLGRLIGEGAEARAALERAIRLAPRRVRPGLRKQLDAIGRSD